MENAVYRASRLPAIVGWFTGGRGREGCYDYKGGRRILHFVAYKDAEDNYGKRKQRHFFIEKVDVDDQQYYLEWIAEDSSCLGKIMIDASYVETIIQGAQTREAPADIEINATNSLRDGGRRIQLKLSNLLVLSEQIPNDINATSFVENPNLSNSS